MNWNNLADNRYPECGGELLNDSKAGKKGGIYCGKCDFKLGKSNFNRIRTNVRENLKIKIKYRGKRKNQADEDNYWANPDF